MFGSVLGEAALTGLIASLIGLGLGVLAALGPEGAAQGVRDRAAVGAARVRGAHADRRASPSASASPCSRRSSRPGAPCGSRRSPRWSTTAKTARDRCAGGGVIAGGVVGLAGVAVAGAGLAEATVALVGLGRARRIRRRRHARAARRAPAVERARAPARRGCSGPRVGSGRENSMRNPRRTAQTAAALMIGLALVSTIAVLGASLSTSAQAQRRQRGQRRLHRHRLRRLQPVGRPRGLAPAGRDHGDDRVPGTVRVPRLALEHRGRRRPRGLSQTVNLHVTAGRGAAAMAAGQLLVDSNTASADHLHVGSVVPVNFAQTGPTTMRIGGILRPTRWSAASSPAPASSSPTSTTRCRAPFCSAPLPARARFERTLNRALGAYPTSASRAVRSSSSPEAQHQPAAGTDLRAAGAGDPDRADRDRQHAHAVGVRAHARDRAPAGGRNEAPPGAADDPLRVGDRRAVRRRDRDRHRHRAGLALASSLRNSGVTSIVGPDRQPDRLPGPVGAARPRRRDAGRRAGPPASTCSPRSPTE